MKLIDEVTAYRNRRLVELYAKHSDKSLHWLAEYTGYDRKRIGLIIRAELNVDTLVHFQWTPEMDETIRRMWTAGDHWRDICQAAGISESTLRQRIYRLKLPVRRRNANH